jgi:hypothetical protein
MVMIMVWSSLSEVTHKLPYNCYFCSSVAVLQLAELQDSLEVFISNGLSLIQFQVAVKCQLVLTQMEELCALRGHD